MIEAVFWVSIFLLVYPYLVYPLLIALLGIVRPRPVRKQNGYQPNVTVLIPAYNEADCIEATLRNMLRQTYPKNKLQIMVVSDGSDDGTDDIVRRFADQGIELLRQEGRGGKALALNAAVRHATGEIIVFSDANSLFAPEAVSRMVENFADPEVGYLTGALTLQSSDGSVSGGGSGAYMRYENMLRATETRVGSVIGVNGGIDAIRRELYSDIPRELITDFVLPLRVIAAGHRVVFEPRAQSAEAANTEITSEFRMRVRVALRALQGLMHMRQLFNPLRYPMASFCLVSHKLLRYMAFVFMATALLSNAWLALFSPLYQTLLLVHLVGYGLALLGLSKFAPPQLRLLTVVPSYLLMTYAAFAMATVKFLRGQSMATWQPRAG